MNLINLTPHVVTVNGLLIQPQPVPARLSQIDQNCGSLAVDGLDIDVYTCDYLDVTGLPDSDRLVLDSDTNTYIGIPNRTNGNCYIVSPIVLSACQNRGDLFAPWGLIRDADGNIIGCKGLMCNRVYKKFH